MEYHNPPIQKTHWAYALALFLVRSGVTRFHRLRGSLGADHFPHADTPMILVSNHQNGLMDPLVNVTIVNSRQVHWLTRADVFRHPVIRACLFAFNQMPIFRIRDRVDDAKVRNERIFKICVERLKIGATIGLFPEGNHHGQKTLRTMKRGVSDLLSMGLANDPEFSRLQLIPVGLDYEQYDSFQRRLRYRIGPPIPYTDLFDSVTKQITSSALLERIEKSIDDLMVNVQPKEHYEILYPFIRAMRMTELESDAWLLGQKTIRQFKTFSSEAFKTIAEAHANLVDKEVLEHARPEDIGLKTEDRRRGKWWLWPLAPLALIGGLPSLPLAWWIGFEANKRVKNICFVSTFKVSVGMFLFPLFWILQSIAAGFLIGNDLWSGSAFFGWYAFNIIGSRISGFWYGHFLDWKGAQQARRVWNQPEHAKTWKHYIDTVLTLLR